MNREVLIPAIIGACVLLIISPFVSWTLFFALWAITATVGLIILLIRFVNETNDYEDIFDNHINNTEQVIESLMEVTNSSTIYKDSPEAKRIVAILRSYMQSLINYINGMRIRYGYGESESSIERIDTNTESEL